MIMGCFANRHIARENVCYVLIDIVIYLWYFENKYKKCFYVFGKRLGDDSMPRFSETEKDKIRTDMMQAAHQCFTVKDLRNTSIEEITSSVSIAKSSFYVFLNQRRLGGIV
jgi:hypothetical protein